jgi:uncharacterized protein
LFRKKETLKVGYSFKADVFALDLALKSNGNGSAVAVIDRIIDIASLHGYLYQQLRCPGVHASEGGLSGVVGANLGLPLDKTQQCSDWGARPLTAKQLRYASMDAACLVALLSYFMQCWDRKQRKVDESIDEEAAEGSRIPSNKSLIHFTQAQLEAASEIWGETWELSQQNSGRKKIQRTRGLSQYDLDYDPLSKKKKNRLAGSMLELPAFPLMVPWMDCNKKVISAPLFLADVMLQGLARQLRLWGFDAEALECVSKTERHLVHRQLVERAEIEGRVILTRDAIFMRRNLSDQAYFVRSEAKKEQLEEIVNSFKLPIMQNSLLSRCARCNGEFGETPVAASELSAVEHGVPPGVLEGDRVKEFWVCLGCKKAYWQGSMYERAMERLGEALQSMTVGGGRASGGKNAKVEQQVCLT